MWKNIFIESSILSLLIFGGFYVNAAFLKDKIADSEEKVRIQQDKAPALHMSGASSPIERPRVYQHVSGASTEEVPARDEIGKEENPAIGIQ